jgi:hypothetical protein
MNNEVVIARYNENLDWIARIPDDFAVIIYNKGDEITSQPALQRAHAVIQLENNGRESDTFIRHILRKKQFGSGYTVFVQGDPFEHSPDIIHLLAASEFWDNLQPLSWRWIESRNLPPPDILSRDTGLFVGGCRVRPETFSLGKWEPLQFRDQGAANIATEYKFLHHLPSGANIAGHFLRQCNWTELGETAEGHIAGRFAYGALFAARQNLLERASSKSFELALEAANSHPMYGYILERLWLHLFGEPFLLPALGAPRAELLDGAAARRFVPPARKKSLARRVVPALRRRVADLADPKP